MHKNIDGDSDQQINLKKMLKNIYLQGNRVSIRNLKTDDYDIIAGLFLDEDVLYYFLPGKLQTYAGSELENLMADWNNMDTAFVFTILHEHKPVGLISCESVDFDMSHLECGVALLSTTERGQGLATEAMTVFINFLFEDLGLHRINARIISGNKASFKLFQRLGFKQEGLQREYVRRGSTYLDMNIFGLLDREWQLLNS